MKKKSKKGILIALVCVIGFFIIVGVISSFSSSSYDDTTVPKNSSDEHYDIEEINIEEYFQENSEIISKTPVYESATISTEEQTLNNYASRGFEECVVTTNYDMDGNYGEAVQVSASSESHPYYEAIFITSQNEIWNIMEVNGTILANPVSYNEQSTREASVLIAETDTITSYDDKNNIFYETKPYENELIVITVDRIDAETLENLTIGAIDEL